MKKMSKFLSITALLLTPLIAYAGGVDEETENVSVEDTSNVSSKAGETLLYRCSPWPACDDYSENAGATTSVFERLIQELNVKKDDKSSGE